MKKLVLMMIASLLVYSNVCSQELTNQQKVKITSEITALFEKSIKAAESIDIKGIADGVNDTLNAGFIDNGRFLSSFDEVMREFKAGIIGIRSQRMNFSDKRITVLSENAVLVTASGHFSLALDDGRTFTGGFAWTFVYSKIDDNWKIIHSHMSNPK